MKRSVNLETNLKSENSNCDAPTSDNSFSTNNCSKLCSVSIGGVQAKVKQHFRNIETDSLKVNKNLGVQNGNASCGLKYCDHQNGTSNPSASSSSALLSISLSQSPSINAASPQRLVEKDGNEIDYYVRHNVDCLNTVDKCPSKVGSQSLENMQGANGHSASKVWNFRDDESSSGNEADETLSDHESCIYTYKGDQFADLPSSFFTLDLIANSSEQNGELELPQEVEIERVESDSSPDMDFLEMDFDPGPSLEQDSEEDYDCYDSKTKVDDNNSPVPELPNEEMTENDLSRSRNNDADLKYLTKSLENDLGISSNVSHCIHPEPQPGPSNAYLALDSPEKSTSLIHKKSIEGNCNKSVNSNTNSVVICNSSNNNNNNNNNNNINNSNSNYNGTMKFCWPARDSWGHHCTSGDLCSPTEIESSDSPNFWSIGNTKIQGDLSSDTKKYNLQSALYHCIMAKRLVIEKKTLTDDNNSCFDIIKGVGCDGNSVVDTTMIWSEQEACSKQVTQISTSACGATAVINVMIAFNIKCSLDKVKESVATRLRAESAPIPEYLISRSYAGATHEDIIRGIHESSNGSLCARFFHMYPERDFSLSRWLSYWMKKGAVPIATLNLQQGVAPGNPIPDAWHHQMIFGISNRGIFLTNPLECVLEEALLSELCSPSVLKIKRSDIISRWNSSTDLRILMNQEDPRWKEMNVLGQVVNIIRESMNTSVHGRVITQYISIPASYSSGITLVVSKDSPGYDELLSASELPEYPSQPD